jgi:hypothetical protein
VRVGLKWCVYEEGGAGAFTVSHIHQAHAYISHYTYTNPSHTTYTHLVSQTTIPLHHSQLTSHTSLQLYVTRLTQSHAILMLWLPKRTSHSNTLILLTPIDTLEVGSKLLCDVSKSLGGEKRGDWGV